MRRYPVVIILIPICAMQQFPLEILKAWNVRPFPFIQNAGGREKNIARIGKCRASGHVFNLDSILFSGCRKRGESAGSES